MTYTLSSNLVWYGLYRYRREFSVFLIEWLEGAEKQVFAMTGVYPKAYGHHCMTRE